MNNTPVTYKDKMTIAVLSCILLAVIAYRLCISPDMQKMESLELEYDTAQMTLQLLNDKINEIENQESDELLKEYILEYENAGKDIFSLMNTEQICQNVSELLGGNHIAIDSVSADEPQPFIAYDEENEVLFQSDNIYVSKVNISSEGRFRDILSVINDINAQTAYVIENIDISENDDSTASFNLIIDIFMYDDSLIDLEE